MTRSRDKGENEFTRAAKREAMRTGEPVDDILARLLEEAKKSKSSARRAKVTQAQKYIRDRNRDKRKRRS